MRAISSIFGGEETYCSALDLEIDENEQHLYLKSFRKSSSGFINRLNQFFLYFQILWRLARNTDKNSNILIYHDFGCSYFYSVIQKILKRRVSFIVAEIFSAVYDRGEKKITEEIARLSEGCNYIFINNVLPTKFPNDKPYLVCHGNYRYVTNKEIVTDEKIHVIYAGKISQGIINDAFIAADIARFLNKQYHVHILGYGTDRDIEALKVKINVINEERGIVAVSYDGCLLGIEYARFLAKCKIGLCTRTLKDE